MTDAVAFERWLAAYGDPDEAYEFNHRAYREWRSRQAARIAIGEEHE